MSPDSEGAFDVERLTFDIECSNIECKGELNMPIAHFYKLRVRQNIWIKCASCDEKTELTMLPYVVSKNST